MSDTDVLPEWKQFEIAVGDFLRALDPQAKVTHDARIPDAHTGRPRQRDVWIEARICQLFPIKILVSCKFESRRLDQQDIDAFNGEFISSGADKGVIYAKSGFTEAAIEKAKELDFACCRLYANQPPDIPAAIFVKAFHSRNQISLVVREPVPPEWAGKTWRELFETQVLQNGDTKYALDVIADVHDSAVEESLFAVTAERAVPQSWHRDIDLRGVDGEAGLPKIRVGGRWKTWSARVEAYLLNGTYSITDSRFVGSQTTPFVDTMSPDPGPGWELLDPAERVGTGSCQLILQGNARSTLLPVFGHLFISEQPRCFEATDDPRSKEKDGLRNP